MKRNAKTERAGRKRAGIVAAVLIGLVRVYQATLSPVFGGQCRFHPTCSVYAIAALREHGAWRGSALTVSRLVRCHPLSKGGYDPVPVKPEDAGTGQRPR